MEKIPEERKQIIGKIENIIDGIYKDETIEAKDYKKFAEKYRENFEEKIKKDPEFKFDYKTEEKTE